VGGQWLAPDHLRYVSYRKGSVWLSSVLVGSRTLTNVRPKNQRVTAHTAGLRLGLLSGPDLTLNVTPIPPILTPFRCHFGVQLRGRRPFGREGGNSLG